MYEPPTILRLLDYLSSHPWFVYEQLVLVASSDVGRTLVASSDIGRTLVAARVKQHFQPFLVQHTTGWALCGGFSAVSTNGWVNHFAPQPQAHPNIALTLLVGFIYLYLP